MTLDKRVIAIADSIISLSISDYNECETDSENNCGVGATCTNEDPGYSCECESGYRDKNVTAPGTK